jgi:transcriptional regulatory protein RtcR
LIFLYNKKLKLLLYIIINIIIIFYMVVRSPRRVVFGFVPRDVDLVGSAELAHEAAWRSFLELNREQSFYQVQVELWVHPTASKRGARLKTAIEQSFPGSEVRTHEIFVRDESDVAQVFGVLCDFCEQYHFDERVCEYLLHSSSGIPSQQLSSFMLVSGRYFPGKILCGLRGVASPEVGSSIVVDSPEKRASQQKSHQDPLTLVDIPEVLREAFEFRMRGVVAKEPYSLPGGVPVRSPKIKALLRDVEGVVKAFHQPILLSGETGVGRSEIARKVFDVKHSRRLCTDVFIEVNCATLPREFAMRTLFGDGTKPSTRVSDTGHGLLKRVEGGVLFLDEIEALGLDEQAMLVSAIENGEYYPAGGDTPQHSRFQLIAGTSVGLEERVSKGLFRADLLLLLQTWRFDVPALVHRKEDIEPFIHHELKRVSATTGEKIRFSTDSLQEYLQFAVSSYATWPGNFRDLKASVARLATSAERGVISLSTVKKEIRRLKTQWERISTPHSTLPEADGVSGVTLVARSVLKEVGVSPKDVDLFEQAQLAAVIGVVRASSSIAEAGRKLFAVSRKGKASANDSDRLRKYLAKFGIDSKRIVGTHRDEGNGE